MRRQVFIFIAPMPVHHEPQAEPSPRRDYMTHPAPYPPYPPIPFPLPRGTVCRLQMHESSTPPAGLSMFFPAYNDGGTIASLVIQAVQVAGRLTPDFEVIVVNDGSTD